MFLFDTYAIIEIIKGNKNYSCYFESRIIINSFILAELTYWLIKEYGFKVASKYVDKYERFVRDVDSDIIKLAMLFRYKYRKKKLSMVDCIGYIMAKNLGIKFLTGDKEFKDMENVEFAK